MSNLFGNENIFFFRGISVPRPASPEMPSFPLSNNLWLVFEDSHIHQTHSHTSFTHPHPHTQDIHTNINAHIHIIVIVIDLWFTENRIQIKFAFADDRSLVYYISNFDFPTFDSTDEANLLESLLVRDVTSHSQMLHLWTNIEIAWKKMSFVIWHCTQSKKIIRVQFLKVITIYPNSCQIEMWLWAGFTSLYGGWVLHGIGISLKVKGGNGEIQSDSFHLLEWSFDHGNKRIRKK